VSELSVPHPVRFWLCDMYDCVCACVCVCVCVSLCVCVVSECVCVSVFFVFVCMNKRVCMFLFVREEIFSLDFCV
jgi:hypothetical protein